MKLKAILSLFYIFTAFTIYAQEETNSSQVKSDALTVFYDKVPPRIYKNELLELKLRATLNSIEDGTLKSELSEFSGVKPINSNIKWRKESDGSFSANYYLKVLQPEIKLPKITTNFMVGEEIKLSVVNEPSAQIAAGTFATSAISCGVIASSLSVANYKIDDYNKNSNILLLDISAKNANLEDFKIPNIQTQGISSIKNSPNDGKLFYYVVIPSSQKSFEFDYFDKEKGEIQKISVSLDLTKIEDKVSTQTDLQPKSTDKAMYVFLTVAVIGGILYGVYYFKREKIFLILIVITVASGIIFLFIPNEQAKIKKDTVVYLLPTENSTPFYKAVSDTPVEKLKESEGYIKVKLEDGKIGWVKGESIVGN